MKYYKTDSRKISFGEYWRISRGPSFLIGWFNKIFGIQMNFTSGIPEPQPFSYNIIEANTVPPRILEKLNSGVRDLDRLGFNQFWFYTSKQSLTTGLSFGVQALHSSYKVIGKVIYVSYKTRESFVLALISDLEGGDVLGTTNKKQDFNGPPDYIIQRHLGASALQLWDMHQKTLAKLARNHNSAKSITDLDQVAEFEEKTLRMSYGDKIRRGIWVEMTDSEVAQLRSKRVPPPISS